MFLNISTLPFRLPSIEVKIKKRESRGTSNRLTLSVHILLFSYCQQTWPSVQWIQAACKTPLFCGCVLSGCGPSCHVYWVCSRCICTRCRVSVCTGRFSPHLSFIFSHKTVWWFLALASPQLVGMQSGGLAQHRGWNYFVSKAPALQLSQPTFNKQVSLLREGQSVRALWLIWFSSIHLRLLHIASIWSYLITACAADCPFIYL